ncbi:MAG: HDOD domain-containing protein [Aminivibrio sp.]|jgi:putative nucleotidyltransferase with HDIG domain
MEYISASRLKSGMVLSGDLIAPNGRFILPKGARLTQKNIMSIKIWGVPQVPVVKSPELPSALVDEILFSSSVLEESRRIVLERFSGNSPRWPAMEEIFSIAITETATRLSEGAPPPHPGILNSRISEIPPDSSDKVDMEEILNAENGLASFPDVYARISEALRSPRSSASHISDLVSKDTALSATLLKLANSAIYGVPGRVDSIFRATALIGGRALSTLALGVSAIRLFKDISVKWVNMEYFWKHSISVAVIAQILASKKNPRSIELLFAAGMLHDIGRLALFRHAPLTMSRLITVAAERKLPLDVLEREALGFDHGELGGRLLEGWNFPISLTESIRSHHSARDNPKNCSAAILSAADVIASVIGEGNSGSWHIAPLPEETWKATDLPVSVLEGTAQQARRQISEIYNLFRGE